MKFLVMWELELERLLAMAPVYNFARYDVYPLAEMEALGTQRNRHS